jgi:hypothetical protein
MPGFFAPDGGGAALRPGLQSAASSAKIQQSDNNRGGASRAAGARGFRYDEGPVGR